MATAAENNKRIAKNTLLLYVRMIFLMAVTLYTSRVVLQILGVEDFGIYNIVGGVVSMFSFLGGPLCAATARFLTIEIGRGTDGDVNKMFRSSITIHYIIAILIIVLAETVGLWFVLQKLIIPDDRMFAAFWVYQFSILTFLVSIVSAPYNALIIAYEKMSAFAYISILDAFLKLFIVISLYWVTYDTLIIYALLLLLEQICIRIIYSYYCNLHFNETSARWLWSKELSLKIFSYAGWTFSGGLSVICYTQGLNILLNLFFGPTVNAARGIAVQVQAAIGQFFGNFQMAVRPQIVKSYAQGNFEYMHKLITDSSRYSFFLILLVAIPILINTEYILSLWLGNVPEHTVAFTRIMIIASMNGALSNPTMMGIHATGNIKTFQIVESACLLTILPISYVLLCLFSISPEQVFLVYLVVESLTQFVRVWIIYPRIKMPIKKYFTDILYPIIKVMIPLGLVTFFLFQFANNTFLSFVFITIMSLFSTLFVLFMIGLRKDERIKINNIISNKIKINMF